MSTPNGRGWQRAIRERRLTLIALAAVGLLLWARLIVVSDMPRTAIADEEAKTAARSSSEKRASTVRVPDGGARISSNPMTQPASDIDFPSEPEKSAASVAEDRK